MICIIATFLNEIQFSEFLSENSNIFNSNKYPIYLVSSISNKSSGLTVNNKRIHLLYKSDNSYSEGWNNCIEFLKELHLPITHILFLGNGDKMEICQMHGLEEDRFYCTRFSRDDKLVRNKLNSKFLWFISVGVWTPSILWPYKMLTQFKFPEKYKIAADLSLFFTLRKVLSRKTLINIDWIKVNMSSTGMSSNNNGSTEYSVLFNEFYRIKLGVVGHMIRKLLSEIRKK